MTCHHSWFSASLTSQLPPPTMPPLLTANPASALVISCPGTQWATAHAERCTFMRILKAADRDDLQGFRAGARSSVCDPDCHGKEEGSPVRVRQRVSETALQRGFLVFGAARMTTSERSEREGVKHGRWQALRRRSRDRGARPLQVQGTDAVHAGRSCWCDRPAKVGEAFDADQRGPSRRVGGAASRVVRDGRVVAMVRRAQEQWRLRPRGLLRRVRARCRCRRFR